MLQNWDTRKLFFLFRARAFGCETAKRSPSGKSRLLLDGIPQLIAQRPYCHAMKIATPGRRDPPSIEVLTVPIENLLRPIAGLQMGHSSAVMTARCTGEIPVQRILQEPCNEEPQDSRATPIVGGAFQNEIGKYGKWPVCTNSRLVMYNQQAREKSGRRTMAV